MIAAAALALHELRYLIGFGDHAGEALAARGHAYLPFAGGLAGLLLALAGAQLLTAIERARRTARGERPPSFARLWLGLAAMLLLVYSGQELLEALLTRGQQLGPAVPFAEGGWSAIPLALALGAAAALLLKGASRAVAAAAGRARPSRLRPARGGALRPSAPVRVRRALIARNLAGRAPPALRPLT
ncbi:MAG: hypothetical protein JW895_02890 [Thermoleophilaceae bacterium]|nr:hypothetical protein [Thermoleophilaceae bacterium]